MPPIVPPLSTRILAMPIAAQCPNCSAKFQVKDEYAGRRGKCPKCGEAIQLPAAKPRPADDEPDEQPRKKRVTDEEDDRPKRRSRQEDEEDDRPRKKKSALPLLLGILGGALLLCGGGVAGVWFGVIKPAAEQARARNDALEAEIKRRTQEGDKPAPTPPTSPVQVPAPAPAQLPVVTADELANNVAKYRGQTVTVSGIAQVVVGSGEKGTISLRGGKKNTLIACMFETTARTAPPSIGDQVEIRGLVEAISNEDQVRLQKCDLVKVSVPSPTLKLPAAELLKELRDNPWKHDTKWFTVTGMVKYVDSGSHPGHITIDLDTGRVGESFLCRSASRQSLPPDGLTVGDQVEVTGQFFFQNSQLNFLHLFSCRVGGHTKNAKPAAPVEQKPIALSAEKLADEYDAEGADADARYHLKVIEVTGVVRKTFDDGYLSVVLGGAKSPLLPAYSAVTVFLTNDPAQKKGHQALKAGDTVTVVGTLRKYRNGNLIVTNASLKSHNPVPNPVGGTPITVEVMVKDAAKLDGKVILVTGNVSEVEDEIQPPSFKIMGQGKLQIGCSPTVKGFGKMPAKGDTVTVRGTLTVYDMNDGTKSYELNQCQLVTGKQ